MKKYLLFLLCLLFISGDAFSYIKDKVLLDSKSSPDNEAKNIASGLVNIIANNLAQKFLCLDVMTKNEVDAMMGWAHKQQLLNTPDAEQIDLKKLGDAMGAKYLILIKAMANKANSTMAVSITGINNKNASMILSIAQTYPSSAAAADAAEGMSEKLIKGFSESLSGQEGGYGEICPFTGRVDVYREVKRDRNKQTKQKTYCKGIDQEKSETEKYTHSVREVWALERIGNPDTKGGLEAIWLDETVDEEVDSCYVCGPDEIGRHVWNRTVSETGEIRGLSEKSQGESIKNKDATVRLHFNKDGTYTVTVKAVSEAGKKTKTIKETATGLCNNFNKSDPPATTPLRLPLEYTFGPFTGTPFITKLAEKQEIKLSNKDLKEDTILRIDFQLERPSNK
jgi:hypothetical protein